MFLGFTNFYRRFIEGYSRVARALTGLLTGDQKFEFSEEARQSFRRLKEAFTTAPLLRHFSPELPLRMETDASDFAISAILA